jgi:hypothetical protein
MGKRAAAVSWQGGGAHHGHAGQRGGLAIAWVLFSVSFFVSFSLVRWFSVVSCWVVPSVVVSISTGDGAALCVFLASTL